MNWSIDQVAAVDRLQQQYLPDWLSGGVCRRPEHEQTSQRHPWKSATRAGQTHEAPYWTFQVFALRKDIR